MESSAVEIYKQKIAALKEKGLQGIHFSLGNTEGLTEESFCAEANRLLDAIENGKYEPLVFNDSKPKL